MLNFEAKIIVYCCQFWGYTAADLAGSLRLKYPSNIRIVKLPCTGRITPLLILKAIENGADGICAVGCLEGDCHFIDGNIKARRIINYSKKILESIGIEPERVAMYNLSSSDALLFAKYAHEFTDIIKKLGPVYGSQEAVNE